MFVKRIDCVDNVVGMQSLADGCIPLTVTSPPWDGFRKGNGYQNDFDFPAVAKELWRITSEGGIVCWDVRDQIVDGGETGTSFRQALFFQELGFNLYETLVMLPAFCTTMTPRRNGQTLQYVFVLSKGLPNCVSPIGDVPNKLAGRRKDFPKRNVNGSWKKTIPKRVRNFRRRGSVWMLATGNHVAQESYASQHPALMTEAEAYGLIVTYSKPLDLVFDPFCGAGTTCKMAALNNRFYLGFEQNPKFVEIARQRILDSVPDGSVFVTA